MRFVRGEGVDDDPTRDLNGAPFPNSWFADVVTLIAPPTLVKKVVDGVCDVILDDIFAVWMLIENVIDPRSTATARSNKQDWELYVICVWHEKVALDKFFFR